MQAVLVWFFSVVSIAAAVSMILQRYMVYSIGLMIMTLLGIAGLFLTLNAPFLALVQVIVYAGAVMVLFVFSSMIVGEKASPDLNIGNAYSWLVLGIVSLFFLDFWLIIVNTPFPGGLAGSFQIDLEGGHPITYLGTVLFTEYALALQSVALVLLVALVGAVYISGEGRT